jgi:hypothetical protein
MNLASITNSLPNQKFHFSFSRLNSFDSFSTWWHITIMAAFVNRTAPVLYLGWQTEYQVAKKKEHECICFMHGG